MSIIRAAAAALSVAVLSAAIAGSALADPRDDHRDRRPRHRVVHRAPPPPAVYGYDTPTYVEAPPPMVYAPPQMPAVLSFGLTLPIR
ncbi:MAG TPA: hypothetical protein VN802_17495 [Stellaceae bacterium]|nr:hypothetical protein [Stellaceae bacterium]